MRHASALALPPHLVEHPLPLRAAAQLRLAFEMLPAGRTRTEASHAGTTPRAAAGGHPHLAWPERPPRARLSDGSAAPRRDDFYAWILARRRRAQLTARRALAVG